MSPQAGPEGKGDDRRSPSAARRPRSLAGATILQLVPALRDDPAGHAAVDIALALLQSGARAIVAGEGGPLVGELRAFGGEWLPMPNDTFNPLRIRGNARRLANLIAGERIDIVHAQSAGAAWSAIAATDRMPVFLVTSFPDRLAADSWPVTRFGSVAGARRPGDRAVGLRLARDDRALQDRARPHHRDPARGRHRHVSVRRRSSADRIAALRRVWGILPQMRVVLVPGRIAPWNGQMSMIDAARLMVGDGDRNIAFVFAGEDRGQTALCACAAPARAHARHRHAVPHRRPLRRYAGRARRRRRRGGAGAGAAARPAAPPPKRRPWAGRWSTTTVGVLPENVLCPPRMRDELRTGWLVRPGNVGETWRARSAPRWQLDVTSYEALGARARQFAEFMFSPQSVAEAIRGVYTSLLARDA